MKKNIIILLALAACLIPANAQKRFALGAGVGVDGINIESATKVNDWLQIQAGVSYIGINKSGLCKIEMPKSSYTDTEILDKSVYFRHRSFSGNINLTFFPWKDGFVHFNLGAYIGNNNLFDVFLDELPAYMLEEGLRNEKYIYRAKDGVIEFHAKNNAFRPFIGVGIGKPVSNEKIMMTFDLGLQYMGKTRVYGNREDYAGKTEYALLEKEDVEPIGYIYESYINTLTFWPVLNVRLWFKP